MQITYAHARKTSTANAALIEKSSNEFARFVLSLRVTPSPRGKLIDTLQTLINAGTISITCWRDLACLLARRDAGHLIMPARALWAEFKSSFAAVSPAKHRRTDDA
ncbi:hypothetical protein [Bradyrhizobium genosp. P]|uniref:hypothetical protein n=1 Tax=Bradyrhizobium genosp. P TaxID=83641 RepID=UPI003CF8FD8D